MKPQHYNLLQPFRHCLLTASARLTSPVTSITTVPRPYLLFHPPTFHSSPPSHQHIRPFSTTITPTSSQPPPPQPRLRQGYANESTEPPNSFWRTHHNLPDEYVTPLAETPAESYTILNDLVQHPIRYRSWNGILEPQYRPQTQLSNNDYLPQKVQQRFDSTKQFSSSRSEEDHGELVRQALITGNLREFIHALSTAPPEYTIGFGLLVSAVVLYSHYSNGYVGSFNYDAWIDGHFRDGLIYLDQVTKFGDRIDQWEKDWEKFEEEHSQLANFPIEMQSFVTRTYIWARDTLFPDNYMEASRWKQKRHQINDEYSLEKITGRTLSETQKATTPSPIEQQISKTDPRMALIFARERERDEALIEVEQLRLKMMQDNRGYPLNRSQEYILRGQLRNVANSFKDVIEGTGLEAYNGMSEIEYDEFKSRQQQIEAAALQFRSSYDKSRHPTTGLPKADPFKEQTEHLKKIEHQQRLHDEQLGLLSRHAQQQFTQQQIDRHNDQNSDKNHDSSPKQSKPQAESPLTTSLRQHQQTQQNQELETQQDQQSSSSSGGLFSWIFSSTPQPVSQKELDRSAKLALKAAEIERQKIQDEAKQLYQAYAAPEVDRARVIINPTGDDNSSTQDSNYALEMMKRVDGFQDPGLHRAGGDHSSTTTSKMSHELREDYRRELYGDITPSRGELGRDRGSSGRHQQGFATADLERDLKDESWKRLGIDPASSSPTTITGTVLSGTKTFVENPFSWLSSRDTVSANDIIEKSVSATLQYRAEKDLLLEKSDQAQRNQDNSDFRPPQRYPDLDSNNSTGKNRSGSTGDDDIHSRRLKGGLLGGWFGSGK